MCMCGSFKNMKGFLSCSAYDHRKMDPALSYIEGKIEETTSLYKNILEEYREYFINELGYIDILSCDAIDLGENNEISVADAILNRFRQISDANDYHSILNEFETNEKSDLIPVCDSKYTFEKVVALRWGNYFKEAPKEVLSRVESQYIKRIKELLGNPIKVHSIRLRENTPAIDQFREFYDIERFFSCDVIEFPHYALVMHHHYAD